MSFVICSAVHDLNKLLLLCASPTHETDSINPGHDDIGMFRVES